MSNDAFGLLGKMGTAAALIGATGCALNKALRAELSDNSTFTLLTHGGTFDATQIPGSSISCELGFAIQSVPEALKVIINALHAYPFVCPLALRFVRPSSALLAFTKFRPHTCTIEFPTANTARARQGFRHVWRALDQSEIPYTFHWGQCFQYDEDPQRSLARLRRVFDENQDCGRVDKWLQARSDWLSKKSRLMFSNQMLCRLGLAQ